MKSLQAAATGRTPFTSRIARLQGSSAVSIAGLVALAMVPWFLSDFHVGLLSKFLVFAIVAVSLDLIWGYAGILSIGHGVFFGLGAYAFAMYLKMEAAGSRLPDFMAWSGLVELPWFWRPFGDPAVAIIFVFLVPMAVGAGLSFLAFRSGIQGVYFSIVTQALALILSIFLVGQQPYFGGTNGLTNFSTAFGFPLQDPNVQFGLYYIALGGLALAYAVCAVLTRSRFGLLLVALRDNPGRVRSFGYNPVAINVIVFTISAGLAGLAGAIFAPIVGIVSPAMIGVVPSIEMVIWVAVGGRGTLIGAVLGALVVNGAKSSLSESFPLIWQFILGALFIGSVLLFPRGVVGTAQTLMARWRPPRPGEAPRAPVAIQLSSEKGPVP